MSNTALPKLLIVQKTAKAPRSIDGKFGKSRSAEQILEAYKPICNEQGLYLYTTDEMKQIGERNYVVSTAYVADVETGDVIFATASAWENQVEVNKYGAAILDTSQVSGKTSSYAKKYALQNLFAVDDTSDADNDHDYAPPAHNEVESTPIENQDVLKRAKRAINEELERQEYTAAVAKKAFITKVLGHSTIDNLNEADLVMDALENEA